MGERKLTAVVLAGGVGGRFWPLTTHKILFPFLGKPFVEHAVIQALPKEVEQIVFVANPENRGTFENLKLPIPHVTIVQRMPLGMADALIAAESELQNTGILVVIADDLVNAALYGDVIGASLKSNAFGILPGWRPDHYYPGGYYILEKNRIVGISEKPGAGSEPSEYVNITGHFFADAGTLINQLKETKSDADDVYEKTITTLMSHQDFELLPYKGAFSSLKYSWDVLHCMDELLSGLKGKRGKNVQIGQNVVIEGEVEIEDNVRIFENTKIVGPCFIGANTIIGNNNIIRASHIGRNCITGFSTDITRSYVGDGCWFHSNYIGDSVLEENISMGAGAVLANLRLDEGHISSQSKGEKVNTYRNKLGAVIGRDVRIGVNVSVMPGVKIGARSFIGAGVVLDKDVAEDCYCVQKSDVNISKNLKQAAANRDEFKKQL